MKTGSRLDVIETTVVATTFEYIIIILLTLISSHFKNQYNRLYKIASELPFEKSATLVGKT